MLDTLEDPPNAAEERAGLSPLPSPNGRSGLPAVSPLERALALQLRDGEDYAHFLDERGLSGAALQLRETFARLNPPGPLLDVAALRQGDPAAASRLRRAIESGALDVRARADDPEQPPEDWRYSVALWTHNDNAAFLRDGVYRSDDGPTASLGADFSWGRGDDQKWTLSISHNMFTERDGGMSRTDIAELTLRHLTRRASGTLFFDSVTRGWLVGLQGTGNFGGARLQDGFHALMSGTALAGRRLGAGLQDQYTGPRELAALVGAEWIGHCDLGLLDLDLGARAAVPLGPTGVGSAGLGLGARLGRETGPYVDTEVNGAYQWVQGDALRFDGAPRTGVVVSPRVLLGWQFDSINLAVEWQGNRWGTQAGLGDLYGESVALRVNFSSRR